MSKKFTAKPIKQATKKRVKESWENEQAEERLEDFYENQKSSTIEKPKKTYNMWGVLILVSILFGFASGLVYNFLFNQNIEIDGNQKVVVEKQEDVTVTSEERLKELAESINPTIVNFYAASEETNGPFYQDIYSFGTGFILTSDGWIVTTQSVMDKINDKDYVILTSDYKIYNAVKTLKDPISPAVFVKIEAGGLPVAKLGDLDKLSSGQKVYGFIAAYPEPKIASLHLADLKATALEDVVASSEQFSHFISSRETYDSSLIGAPIVNLAGEIIAIIYNQQMAIPMDYLKTVIGDLTKKGQVERVELGVHYINLSKYPRINLETGEMQDRGALLSGFRNLLAVIKNSPADKAGLKVGDIILMVEDELVNSKKTLAQMIQEYRAGQALILTILRDGKEKAVEVTLEKLGD